MHSRGARLETPKLTTQVTPSRAEDPCSPLHTVHARSLQNRLRFRKPVRVEGCCFNDVVSEDVIVVIQSAFPCMEDQKM